MNKVVEVKVCAGFKCQYLRCIKRVLRITRRGSRIILECTLTGDYCIEYKCQYAICDTHAMDPTGKCLLELKNLEKERKEKDIIEEAKKMEKEISKIKHHLRKLGLEDYI